MIETLVVTVLPILFLVILFGGGLLFQQKNIDMDGKSPINKTLFYTSKYSIIILWGAMVLESWGSSLSFIKELESMKWVSLGLWIFGFMLLFIGRLELGNSFRIGSSKENTRLKVDGIYTFSRNPMYLGVYATVLASALYTLNPVIFFLAIFVIAVHHKIVLAEEEHMRKVFGKEYVDYCHHVRRYL